MNDPRIDVIATSISGSISDWSKVEKIVPLFAEYGMKNVELALVDSHVQAREMTRQRVEGGSRLLISAGGSGTFNAVLEGCCDSGIPLERIRLGFLRKGSADLIGKTLGMPDEIHESIQVFVESIRSDHTEPCDVLQARAPGTDLPARHFVGYGGAGIFGRIPHFTENRFMKWYKGFFSQLFGDLGPFTMGMSLAAMEYSMRHLFGSFPTWKITVDGQVAAEGRYHALVIVNGYLGKELPFSSDPLGSGHFQLFALQNRGWSQLASQLKAARSGAIADDPEHWGLESFRSEKSMILESDGHFPANVDGSTLRCSGKVEFEKVDRIHLLTNRKSPAQDPA